LRELDTRVLPADAETAKALPRMLANDVRARLRAAASRENAAWHANHSNIRRKRSRSKRISRLPCRGRARTVRGNHTQTFRKIKAIPTYNSRRPGSRVEVRIRAWCNCR